MTLLGGRGGDDNPQGAGASYGNSNSSNQWGGLGGRTIGEVHFDAGQSIYVMVGAPGLTGYTASGAAWNGGGNPGAHGYSGSGGGASDIRTASAGYGSTDWRIGLYTRLLVAGGGGGGACHNCGGAGGGLYGGTGGAGARPGTQNSGNAFGYGGASSPDGGGGGGGYWGGCAGNGDNGGGGGSGYIGGSSTNMTRNCRTDVGVNAGVCYATFYLVERN